MSSGTGEQGPVTTGSDGADRSTGNSLGMSAARRWAQPGPPGRRRPAPLGTVAAASIRFAAGLARPPHVRRLLAGPGPLKPRAIPDATAPPRWWTGVSRPEPVAVRRESTTSAASPAPTRTAPAASTPAATAAPAAYPPTTAPETAVDHGVQSAQNGYAAINRAEIGAARHDQHHGGRTAGTLPGWSGRAVATPDSLPDRVLRRAAGSVPTEKTYIPGGMAARMTATDVRVRRPTEVVAAGPMRDAGKKLSAPRPARDGPPGQSSGSGVAGGSGLNSLGSVGRSSDGAEAVTAPRDQVTGASRRGPSGAHAPRYRHEHLAAAVGRRVARIVDAAAASAAAYASARSSMSGIARPTRAGGGTADPSAQVGPAASVSPLRRAWAGSALRRQQVPAAPGSVRPAGSSLPHTPSAITRGGNQGPVPAGSVSTQPAQSGSTPGPAAPPAEPPAAALGSAAADRRPDAVVRREPAATAPSSVPPVSATGLVGDRRPDAVVRREPATTAPSSVPPVSATGLVGSGINLSLPKPFAQPGEAAAGEAAAGAPGGGAPTGEVIHRLPVDVTVSGQASSALDASTRAESEQPEHPAPLTSAAGSAATAEPAGSAPVRVLRRYRPATGLLRAVAALPGQSAQIAGPFGGPAPSAIRPATPISPAATPGRSVAPGIAGSSVVHSAAGTEAGAPGTSVSGTSVPGRCSSSPSTGSRAESRCPPAAGERFTAFHHRNDPTARQPVGFTRLRRARRVPRVRPPRPPHSEGCTARAPPRPRARVARRLSVPPAQRARRRLPAPVPARPPTVSRRSLGRRRRERCRRRIVQRVRPDPRGRSDPSGRDRPGRQGRRPRRRLHPWRQPARRCGAAPTTRRRRPRRPSRPSRRQRAFRSPGDPLPTTPQLRPQRTGRIRSSAAWSGSAPLMGRPTLTRP